MGKLSMWTNETEINLKFEVRDYWLDISTVNGFVMMRIFKRTFEQR